MTDDDPSVADLSDRIADLPPEERRVLLAALEADRHDDRQKDARDHRDYWETYCEEHPYDPLCRGLDDEFSDSRPVADRRVADRPASGHLDGFADGGGCPEAWEYLSAYRDVRRR